MPILARFGLRHDRHCLAGRFPGDNVFSFGVTEVEKSLKKRRLASFGDKRPDERHRGTHHGARRLLGQSDERSR